MIIYSYSRYRHAFATNSTNFTDMKTQPTWPMLFERFEGVA